MGASELAEAAAGVSLVLFALTDLFLTVFNYDAFTFAAGRYQRMLWGGLRVVTRLLPERGRQAALSVGSGAMLPATVVAWLAIEIVGFGLVVWSGFPSHSMVSSHGVGHGIAAALYLSAGDISTLTFGDVIANSGFYRAMLDIESMVGLATFTLALGYVVTTFSVLSDLDSLHNTVRRNADDPARPSSVLGRHYRGGNGGQLSDLLQDLSEKLEAYDEGLRRYPVVYYFHTRRVDRSVPRVFWSLGELLALVRWGLPADDPMTEDPWLRALLEQYLTTLQRLRRSFVGPDPLPPASPAGRSDFEPSYRGRPSDGPSGIAAFVDTQARARAAADLPGPPDDPIDTAFERYGQWFEFTHLRNSVLERIAERLVYDLADVVGRNSLVSGRAG